MSAEVYRSAAQERLRELLMAHGAALPLGEAVACAGVEDDPTVSVDEVLAQLDGLASGLWLDPNEALHIRIARLVHHLHVHHGFEGDTVSYDDPDNSMLHKVIARRCGLPILLAVVVCEVGARVGLPLHGVGFPGHFLVGVTGAEPRFFLDPFRGGEVVSEARARHRLRGLGWPLGDDERALAPVRTTDILLRMGHNLGRSYDNLGRADDLARVGARMSLVRASLEERAASEHR